jgi:amidase
MDDLIFASAATLARAIREREVSSVEVVEAHLSRIEAVNPKLNAVVQLGAEQARAEAEAADRALAAGEPVDPLHGVPFTAKDWLETAGLICAAGEEARRHYVPEEDATVVARMRAAGAILLGKTNILTENVVYGRTFNPYDLSRTAGYSSSGEAAIIAAGGSPVGLGSDSGGSIRVPAYTCGIAGLKPTQGRVPSTGHYPRVGGLSDPRTQIGPMARFVEDLALVFPIIAGVDWRDSEVVPMPLGAMEEVQLPSLRVAFYTENFISPPTQETVEVTQRAARVLGAAGLVVEETLPPRLDEALAITLSYWRRPESESWDEWKPDGEVHLSSEEVEQSLWQWERFRRSMLRFMEQYDVILTPAGEQPAPPHGSQSGGIGTAYTLPFSLTGYPCVVVRAGTSPEGLPIGVQVVARPWREEVALAVARLIEREMGGWQRPPL